MSCYCSIIMKEVSFCGTENENIAAILLELLIS